MHPLPALAFALFLAVGAASAQERSPEDARSKADARPPTPGSGPSEASAPATQESQGLRLDMPTTPEPGEGSGASPPRECAEREPAPTGAGRAETDCPPAENRR